jgi:hypothetical protein
MRDYTGQIAFDVINRMSQSGWSVNGRKTRAGRFVAAFCRGRNGMADLCYSGEGETFEESVCVAALAAIRGGVVGNESRREVYKRENGRI